MTTFVFPGQGSQKKGMGDTLFDEFKDYTELADSILGYSIKELCLMDKDNQLGETQYTQPALYMVTVLKYLKRMEHCKRKPDFLAGHSLGEYNALFAAGVFNFETGLRLVKKRGELMSRASGGGMAAVIGLTGEKVQSVLQENGLSNITIANYNTPSQTVVAGPRADINNAMSFFVKAGSRLYMPLNVSGAFHSPYMSGAQEEFAKFLEGITFAPPEIPVVSNVTARPYEQDEVKTNLVKQFTHCVQWTGTIDYLLKQGEREFEEIGPGKVLTKSIQGIQKEIV
ncbi:MAG: ACP S-malonyltransferase [bacterium]|nr:ACP S-malonyltransferase [bacterium]